MRCVWGHVLNSGPTRYLSGPFRALSAGVSVVHVAANSRGTAAYVRVTRANTSRSAALRHRRKPRDPRRTSSCGQPWLRHLWIHAEANEGVAIALQAPLP